LFGGMSTLRAAIVGRWPEELGAPPLAERQGALAFAWGWLVVCQ
jgi:hypothetical protein